MFICSSFTLEFAVVAVVSLLEVVSTKSESFSELTSSTVRLASASDGVVLEMIVLDIEVAEIVVVVVDMMVVSGWVLVVSDIVLVV